MIAVPVIATLVLAYLLIRDRREISELLDRQINERKDWLVERRELRAAHEAERAAREVGMDEERQTWRDERSELMTRVQHPEIVIGHAQHTEVDDGELMTVVMDEIDKVGTIETGDNGDGD